MPVSSRPRQTHSSWVAAEAARLAPYLRMYAPRVDPITVKTQQSLESMHPQRRPRHGAQPRRRVPSSAQPNNSLRDETTASNTLCVHPSPTQSHRPTKPDDLTYVRAPLWPTVAAMSMPRSTTTPPPAHLGERVVSPTHGAPGAAETGCCATEARTPHRPGYRAHPATHNRPSTGAQPPFTPPPRIGCTIVVPLRYRPVSDEAAGAARRVKFGRLPAAGR